MRNNSLALSIVVAALVIAGAIIFASGRMQNKQPASAVEQQPKESSSSGGGELWLDEVDSALKNSATAEESCAVAAGTYTSDMAELFGEGLRLPTNVTVTVAAAGATGYCIEAVHVAAPGQVFNYSSDAGQPAEGSC